jgi:endonuclease/exonuclease/phosphatase (EEP) superfamily protein YafD
MTITTTPAGVRPARRVARTVLLGLLVLPGLLWAMARLVGWEAGYLVQVFAFTPYAAAWAWVPVVVTLLLRRWMFAAFAVLAAVLLTIGVLPRALADSDRGPATGVPLTVLTVNVFLGDADPAAIVRMVRDNDVAVLAVQEHTPGSRAGLAAAGIDDLLPYQAIAEEPGATGSGLYSRHPMTTQGSRRGAGTAEQEGNQQTYATIQPPGAAPVFVESVHPMAPYSGSALPSWRSDLAALPKADPDGTPRILLGDFNSTLDHEAVRDVLAGGYRDVADVTGKGLSGTWGPYGDLPLPPVVLDHVLVDERIGVRDVRVLDVAGSDHRSVLASLTVPAA